MMATSFSRVALCILYTVLWMRVDAIIRKTKSGSVEGLIEDGIQKYTKIPFAKPPVDDLRFAAPQQADAWYPDTLDATHPLSSVPSCPQAFSGPILSFTEDCLYLNIFAPLLAQKSNRARYPVLIVMHAGSFLHGSSSQSIYDFTNFVQHNQNAIVVTFNYRLGILGWLYDNTFNTSIKGNFGYQDQLLCIKWVKRNIGYFGGDKHKMSLLGISAGATSVALHLLYNNNCIVNGIMLSASIQVPNRDPVSWNGVPQTFSDLVGCPTSTAADIANLENCWRAVFVEQIVFTQRNPAYLEGWPWFATPFTPTVHTELLPEQPLFMFQDAAASNKHRSNIPPFIMGNVRDEMYFFYDAQQDAVINANGYNGLFFALNNLMQRASLTLRILNHYGITPQTGSLTGNWYYDLLEITTDNWYCAVRNLSDNAVLKMNAKGDDLYYFNFDFIDPELQQLLPLKEVCKTRACHVQDLLFLVNAPEFLPLFEEFGVETLGYWMQELFTNFAIDGDPNAEGEDVWPPYTSSVSGNEQMNNFLRILDPDNFVQQSTFSDPARLGANPVSSSNDLCVFWDTIGYLFGATRRPRE